MQIGYLRLDWATLLAALAGLGAVAIASLVFRRALGWVLGPIFIFETTRLARKGLTFWLRTAMAGGMLVLLYIVAPNDVSMHLDRVRAEYFEAELEPDFFGNPPDLAVMRFTMQRFASEFSNAFLVVMGVIVMLATPLYMASAISEEKEKRSIEFLFATQATSYELVMGKFAARWMILFTILLTSLPILSLTQIWGGVDVMKLIEGIAIIAVASVSYGSVSILCSAVIRRTRNAVIVAYVLLFLMNSLVSATGYWGLPSPVGLTFYLGELRKVEPGVAAIVPSGTSTLVGYSAFHAVISVVSLVLSVVLVRRCSLRSVALTRRALPAQIKVDPSRPVHPLTVKDNPPIGDRPLVWKERYLGRTFGGWAVGSTMWLVLNLAIVVFFPILLIVGVRDWQLLTEGGPMRGTLLVLGSLVTIGVGMRMASCVSREREQQTMLSLLSLPMSPASILWAKWLGTLLRSGRAFLGLGMIMVLTAVSAAMPVWAWLLLPVVIATHIWFVGSLGLFLSVYCRSTSRAFALLVVAMLIITIGPFLVSYVIEVVGGYGFGGHDAYLHDQYVEDFGLRLLGRLVNPLEVWWRLTSFEGLVDGNRIWDDRREASPLEPVVSSIWFGMIGVVLHFTSWRRFRREGEHA